MRRDTGMKTPAHTNGQVCSAHFRMPRQHLLNAASEFHKQNLYLTNSKSKQFSQRLILKETRNGRKQQ